MVKCQPVHWASLEELPTLQGPTSPNPWGAESPNPRGAELDGPKSMDTSGPLAKDVAPNNLSMKSDVQTRPTILSHTNIQTDQGKTNRVVPPSSNCQRGPITPPTKDGGTTQPLLSTLRNPYPAQDARNVDLNAEDPFNRSQRLIGPCLTGLQNLGNTCYMNSTLQCLGNTTCLRDFFITGSYLKDLNKRNVLGYNGELATSFCKMVRKLWSGEQQSFAPERLKDVIEKRHPNYDGLMQHDAHEFMSLLLDGLHEDLNRVTMKPLTEAVVSDGQSDVEVAKQAWKVHRMRNDSFLVDFFQGQFRSTLVCSECSKVDLFAFSVEERGMRGEGEERRGGGEERGRRGEGEERRGGGEERGMRGEGDERRGGGEERGMRGEGEERRGG